MIGHHCHREWGQSWRPVPGPLLPAAPRGWSVQRDLASPAPRGRRCSGAGTASPEGSLPTPWAGSPCASSCRSVTGSLRPRLDRCPTWCLGAKLDLWGAFPGRFPAHAVSVGCGTTRPGRGAAGGTRRVPAGSDTRLTARGWKAPRDLTSDPLSSHRARRTLPHRPEAETNFVRSVASYAHPRGRARGARGLRPAHAPEGAGPRHLLPAPTHLRNATWPGPGAERWDQGSGSQLQGRKWPAPPFGECFRSAYCVLFHGGGGTTGHKGCQSRYLCKFVSSSGSLPLWGWGN